MKNLFLFFIIYFFLSCSERQTKKPIKLPGSGRVHEMVRVTNPSPTILIPKDAIDNITITDSVISGKPYISEEKFIPLDIKNGPIGTIDKILFYKDHIYIADRRINEAVFIYDTLGVSIHKINERGKGPKEYYGVGDICIDTVKKELILEDRLSKRRLFYDLNGQWRRTEVTKLNIMNIERMKNSTLYRSSYGQNWLIKELEDYPLLSGINDSIVYRGFRFLPYEKCDWDGGNIYRNYKDDIFYHPTYSDTIYSILSDSSYCVATYFKFDNSMFRKLASLTTGSIDIILKMRKENYQRFFDLTFQETNNSILYGCVFETSMPIRNYLYNKINKISYKLNNKVDFGVCRKLYSTPISNFNNFYIGEIEAKRLCSYTKTLDKKKIEAKNPKLSEIISNIKENDNPVLLLYKFKFAN